MSKEEEQAPNEMETIAIYAEAGDYKDTIVNMYGVDGNALVIISTVQGALKRAGAPKRVLDAFFKEATSGDYKNVLKTCHEWVTLVHIAPIQNKTTDAISAFSNIGLDL